MVVRYFSDKGKMKMFQTNAGRSKTNYLVVLKLEVKGYEYVFFK